MEYVTIGVAVYAALLASAHAAWQVYAAQKAEKTVIRVEARVAVLGFETPLSVVSIRAYNHSRHPVKVTSMGFQRRGATDTYVIVKPQPFASLPGVIEPRDSAMTYLDREEARQAGLLGVPVFAWVTTALGETFSSEEFTFNADY